MPTWGDLYAYDRARAERRQAWREHYEAKGCSERKASKLAWRKVP